MHPLFPPCFLNTKGVRADANPPVTPSTQGVQAILVMKNLSESFDKWEFYSKKSSTDVRMESSRLGTIMSIYVRYCLTWGWGMIKVDMSSRCHHEESLNQVSTPTVEEKKLQKIQESLTKVFEKSLGELFERCFASNDSQVEEYERLTELAANLGISTEEVRKQEEEVKIFVKQETAYLTYLQAQLCKNVSSLQGKNKRKEKRRLKRHLKILTEFNTSLRVIVEQAWWCLSLSQKEYFENLTASLATLSPDIRARIIVSEWKSSRRISPIKELHLQFYASAVQLIQAVVDADDADASLFSTEDSSLSEKFLNLLSDDVDKGSVELAPYTVEMDLELNELLDGIEVD